MKKRRKAKNRPLLIAVISIIAVISAIGFTAWAVHNSAVKREIAMNKEMDRIGLPGKAVTRSYADKGCTTGATFGLGVRTCNTFIQETFATGNDFCSDFDSFDAALRRAGYQYIQDKNPQQSVFLDKASIEARYGSNPSACDYYMNVATNSTEGTEIIGYALNTTYSTTNNFAVDCEIGTAAKPYDIDLLELNAVKSMVADRSQTYGCILRHN